MVYTFLCNQESGVYIVYTGTRGGTTGRYQVVRDQVCSRYGYVIKKVVMIYSIVGKETTTGAGRVARSNLWGQYKLCIKSSKRFIKGNPPHRNNTSPDGGVVSHEHFWGGSRDNVDG